MTAIKTNNLSKNYKDINAVDSLNLEIRKGELFALLGVNGAGKTTLLNIVGGKLLPVGYRSCSGCCVQ